MKVIGVLLLALAGLVLYELAYKGNDPQKAMADMGRIFHFPQLTPSTPSPTGGGGSW